MFIMKLAQEAGIPDGCINVFHGTIDRRLPFNYVKLCDRKELLMSTR